MELGSSTGIQSLPRFPLTDWILSLFSKCACFLEENILWNHQVGYHLKKSNTTTIKRGHMWKSKNGQRKTMGKGWIRWILCEFLKIRENRFFLTLLNILYMWLFCQCGADCDCGVNCNGQPGGLRSERPQEPMPSCQWSLQEVRMSLFLNLAYVTELMGYREWIPYKLSEIPLRKNRMQIC